MRSPKQNVPESRPNPASLMLRLMLCPDEIFRLPVACQGVQVVSGLAWLTVAGEDILLKSGQKLWLLTSKEIALVSALGHAPLILEVLGDNTSSSPGMLYSPARLAGSDLKL